VNLKRIIREELDDLEWVRDIPTYNFWEGEHYIDISHLDDDESCEIQQAILDIGIRWFAGGDKLIKRHCSKLVTSGYIIQNATLYRTSRSFDEYTKLLDNRRFMKYIDGRSDFLK
jgi:hypothetical protein|tara:strand:+ start:1533 stop:1877 length:345 start_codon:yes stop_codon:yes gene_type:complete